MGIENERNLARGHMVRVSRVRAYSVLVSVKVPGRKFYSTSIDAPISIPNSIPRRVNSQFVTFQERADWGLRIEKHSVGGGRSES